VSVTVTLTRWIPDLTVSPKLIQSWNEFIAELTGHEARHVQFARKAADEGLRRLQSMPGCAAGSEAKQAVQALVNEVTEELRVQEREQDRQTRHGHTQSTFLRHPERSVSGGEP